MQDARFTRGAPDPTRYCRGNATHPTPQRSNDLHLFQRSRAVCSRKPGSRRTPNGVRAFDGPSLASSYTASASATTPAFAPVPTLALGSDVSPGLPNGKRRGWFWG